MKAKPIFRIVSLVVLFSVILVNVGQVKALGTPQIASINPPSGSPVGSNVCIRAQVNWDSDFRSMRIRFEGSGWNESAEINFERCFDTTGYSPRWYKIRVEVAKVGEDWGSATWTEASYELTANQPAPQPQPQPQSTSCSVDSYDAGPRQATVGNTIHLSASGSCNNGVGVRATRAIIDGSDIYEIGSPSLEWDWNTSGWSAGKHTLYYQVAGQGDNNWSSAAQSPNIIIRLSNPNEPAPVDNSSPFNNCDVIGLNDGRIFVVTTDGGLEKHHVPSEGTLDALGIPRAWIDNKGWSNADLNAIHNGSDIPDVNRDYAGFTAFKRQCFPNTAPITSPDNGPAPDASQYSSGVCPGWNTRLKPGDIAKINGEGDGLKLRGAPTTSSYVIVEMWTGYQFQVVGGPKCNEGYTWWQLKTPNGTGWAAEGDDKYWITKPLGNEPIPEQQAAPAPTAQPQAVVPSQPEVQATQDQPSVPADQNGCNWYDSFNCFLKSVGIEPVGGLEVEAAPRLMFTDPTQCTSYVAEQCPFVLEWLSYNADAYTWLGMAQSKKARDLSVTTGSTPEVRAIVVWDPGCKDPNSNWHADPKAGHVGLVSAVGAGNTFSADERDAYNDGRNGHRDNLGVSSCVHFIYVPTCKTLAELSGVKPTTDVCAKYTGLRRFFCKLGWH